MGSSLDQLSDTEKSKVARLEAIVDQYVAADKYVYVHPVEFLDSTGFKGLHGCDFNSG